MPDNPSTPKTKLSTTPSWIMVGFILGALFATGVQHKMNEGKEAKPPAERPALAAVPLAEPPKSTSALKDRTSLSAIESIFAQYPEHATWRHDLTEVALWNAETNKFSECFEIMRSGDYFYFRTIPKLTRVLVRPNPAPDLPLRYTEPEDEQLAKLPPRPNLLPPSTDPNR